MPRNWSVNQGGIIKYLLLVLPYLLLHLLRLLSSLIPRDKKVWLFWHRNSNGFADNAKYFFLYSAIEMKRQGITAVWVTDSDAIINCLRQQGLQSYKIGSVKSCWYHLRAKFYFCDEPDIQIGRHYWLSAGAVWFNLWHGIPLKKIGFDNDRNTWAQEVEAGTLNRFLYVLMMFFFPWSLSRGDYTIALSPLTKKIFASAFRIPLERSLILGYPRCDIFFREIIGADYCADKTTIKAIETFKAQSPTNQVVLYAPTFRSKKSSNAKAGAGIDYARLSKALKQSNAMFVAKYHPRDLFASEEVEKAGYSNIINAPKTTDMNHLLSKVDVLITDYSSVYFDFLLKKRPIIFYPYDLEEYLGNERQMYFGYEQFTPGPKVRSYNELEAAINQALSGKDGDAAKRQRLIELCYDQQDGNSAKRLANYVLENF